LNTLAFDLKTASDDDLRAVLADAHLPSLLPALAHLTGDLSLLHEDFAPNAHFLAGDQGGLTPEQQDEARELAFQALKRYRDAGAPDTPAAGERQVIQALRYLTGGKVGDEYVPLLEEELAYPAEDMRAPRWTKQEIAPDRDFKVAVIGAGMSGLAAAIRLKQAGVPFTVFEKNEEVGGTWFENTYPGARVDNSNHMYSYSFAQKHDWPYHFSTQPVLLDYFRGCADRFGVRDGIRFRNEVTSLSWNEERGAWTLCVRNPDGSEEAVEANAVISAVGQLNRPKMPDIPGIESFQGPYFHSARWDHGVSLAGKRVIAIGNGASASQFIPEVAKEAAKVTVFQRTPSWYLPVPNYHDEVPAGLQWLFQHVPNYAQWYRFWLFWTLVDGLLEAAEVDPAWPDKDLSVSQANLEFRQMLVDYLKESLADRPDLWDKVIPNYPPASKRIVLDNGIWPETLKRDNVELITDEIQEITPRGVRTCDGKEHAADVIIYGTGFHASRFLMPMRVTGRNGADLHEQWGGDARAYMGITLPNFPNFFLFYGPNTNIVVNGSIIYFSECEVTYVMGAIKLLLEKSLKAIDPKKEVHDAYNVRIDEGNLRMAWGISKVPSWYKNEKGRVAQNWPFTLLEYWQQTRQPNPEDYVLA
jgi:4-hydroxyacetophenone monooxygenase